MILATGTRAMKHILIKKKEDEMAARVKDR